MNFLKKIFGSKEKEFEKKVNENKNKTPEFKGIIVDEYFNKRYKETIIEKELIEGIYKTINGYISTNNLKMKVENPIEHPINLDYIATVGVENGIGFIDFCKTFGKKGDEEIVMYLSYAFSKYMIENFEFKLYDDNEPEFPHRFLSLKYNKNGKLLSLYPFEYSLKVLNIEASFESLHSRIKSQL